MVNALQYIVYCYKMALFVTLKHNWYKYEPKNIVPEPLALGKLSRRGPKGHNFSASPRASKTLGPGLGVTSDTGKVGVYIRVLMYSSSVFVTTGSTINIFTFLEPLPVQRRCSLNNPRAAAGVPGTQGGDGHFAKTSLCLVTGCAALPASLTLN